MSPVFHYRRNPPIPTNRNPAQKAWPAGGGKTKNNRSHRTFPSRTTSKTVASRLHELAGVETALSVFGFNPQNKWRSVKRNGQLNVARPDLLVFLLLVVHPPRKRGVELFSFVDCLQLFLFVWLCQSRVAWPCTNYQCIIEVWYNQALLWILIPWMTLVPWIRKTAVSNFLIILSPQKCNL